MKKFIIALISSITFTSLFAACGGEETNPDPTVGQLPPSNTPIPPTPTVYNDCRDADMACSSGTQKCELSITAGVYGCVMIEQMPDPANCDGIMSISGVWLNLGGGNATFTPKPLVNGCRLIIEGETPVFRFEGSTLPLFQEVDGHRSNLYFEVNEPGHQVLRIDVLYAEGDTITERFAR